MQASFYPVTLYYIYDMIVNKLTYFNLLVIITTFRDVAAIDSKGKRSANYEEKQLPQSLLNEMVLSSDVLQPDALNMDIDPTGSFRKSYGGLLPLPIILNDDVLRNIDNQKAFACSQLECAINEIRSPVCACNYNTGNVVTFKNECETRKHNCRFDTEFHVILNEICPWEFQSRRDSSELVINYDDPKYYN